MGEIVQDTSTGFVPEAELILLAGTPEEVVGAFSSAVCATILIATEISQAMGDGCPTTACTSRC